MNQPSLYPHRLGKCAPKHDPRTLLLADYVSTKLPAPPVSVTKYDNSVRNWGMFKNDAVGDCVIVGYAHMVEEWAANAAHPVNITDDQVIAAYSKLTGYDPVTGANDNGTNMLDALKYWRSTGLAGNKIAAYAAIEPGNVEHVKLSISILEGAYVGLALPISAQNQRIWSVVSMKGRGEPGSWGGHCVNLVGYDAHYVHFVSWGTVMKMTWGFFTAYCDEAYGLVSPVMLNTAGTCNDLDLVQLETDLKAMRQAA